MKKKRTLYERAMMAVLKQKTYPTIDPKEPIGRAFRIGWLNGYRVGQRERQRKQEA